MREKLFAGLTCLALSIFLMGCPLFEGPEAAFTATPTEGNVPLTVLFVDQSQPGSTDLTDWLWDFGDGTNSSAQNPSHVYSAPGVYRVTLTVTSRLGNDTETKIDFITVRALPKADFSASPRTGEGPLQVTFTDTSTQGAAPITLYEWDFGDGTTSEDVNPVHIYEDPGVYTVKLKVTTSVGESLETKANFITVQQRPVASFTASPTAGSTPLTVQFTDTSDAGSSPITSWFWTFGDGTSDSRQNPTHVYTQAGTYSVSLSVTTEVGVSPIVTEMDFIEVEELPVADFSASPTTGAAPLNVNFTDLSTGGSDTIVEWLWDFGDSTSSTLPSPSHRYASDGVYDVSLTVTTSSGNTNTRTRANFITAQQSPEAAFSATPRNGEAPLTVQFTDLSDPGSAPITSWQWDFGDGSTSSDSNPFHAYTRAGRYTVTLGVSTAVGSDTATQVNYIEVEEMPTAAFNATPTSGAAPLTVLFADQSTPGSSEITDWAWDFGDGTSSTQQNPSKIYSQAGVYTVKLTVTSAAGSDVITKANHITVRQLPAADFSTNVTTGAAPLTVLFSDESTAGSEALSTWQWDFGDGTTPSSLRNPSHVYAAPGIYTISLTAGSSVGNDTETKRDYLTVRPAVNFTGTPTAGTGSLSVSFSDTTSLGQLEVTSRTWTFGDGSATSSEASPVKIYNAPGVYDVTLTLTTTLDGQSDMRTRAGYIIVRPEPSFTGDTLSGDGTLQVNFTDTTNLGNLEPIGVLWDFGDGTTSQTANPSHTYAEPGTYSVQLTVTTAAGSQTTTRTGYVTVRPVPSFSASVTTGGAPQTITFTDTTDVGSLTVTGRLWNFGDGTTSESTNPIHAYNTPGNYDVTLTLTTAQGAVQTLRDDYIQISPTVAYTVDTATGAAPLTVQFTDATNAGSLTISGYSWDFGDGTDPSTDTNPSHTYAAAGTYDVSLTVTTEQGNTNLTDEDAITVTAKSLPLAAGADGAFPVLLLDTTDLGSVVVRHNAWDDGNATACGVLHTDGGDYIVAGTVTREGDADAALVLMDGEGTIAAGWPKYYGNPLAQRATDVVLTDTGAYLIVGETETGTTQGIDAYIVLVAPTGDVLWERHFGGTGTDRLHGVTALGGGRYAVVGQSDSEGTHGGTDLFVATLDGDGKRTGPVWLGGEGDEAGYDIVATTDGNLVVVGDTATFGANPVDAYLAKLSPALETLASVTVGGKGNDQARGATELADGTIVVVGATSSVGAAGYDAYAFGVDASLDVVLWEQAYGNPGDDFATAVAMAGDDTLVITGSTHAGEDLGNDVLVLKIDTNGVVQLEAAVGGTHDDRGHGIVSAADGSLAIVGLRGRTVGVDKISGADSAP